MEQGRPIEEISAAVSEALEADKDIGNVVFDLYGTLVDIHTDEQNKNFWKKFAKLLRKNGIHYGYKQARAEYFRLCAVLTDAMCHNVNGSKCGSYSAENIDNIENADAGNIENTDNVEIDISDVFLRLCQKKRADITREKTDGLGREFRVMSRSRLKLYDTTIPLLDKLKEQGYRIWLLSNAQVIFTMSELEALGLIPYFDGIAISSEAGVKKPDAAFAGYLFDKYGLNAKNCLMVGNEYASDAAVAINSGMKYVYVVSNLTS